MALPRTRVLSRHEEIRVCPLGSVETCPTCTAAPYLVVARAIVPPRVIVPRVTTRIGGRCTASSSRRMVLANIAIGVIVERRETIGRIKISEVAADARPLEIS